MRSDIVGHNRFCDISIVKFKKWEDIDILYWRLRKSDHIYSRGKFYLNAYKDAYVTYNKYLIRSSADEKGIPPDLLGGIAWIEAGGKPEFYKPIIYNWREQFSFIKGITDADKTSIGSVAMQIRVAAETLGLDPTKLTTRDQLEISSCLLEDKFNLQIVAQHLFNMMLYDYPGDATLSPTNEQYIMAGVRYNRGIQRDLAEFKLLITKKPLPGTPEWDFIFYGMRLLQIRPHIRKLLEVSE